MELQQKKRVEMNKRGQKRYKSGTYGIGQQLQTKNPSIREAQKA